MKVLDMSHDIKEVSVSSSETPKDDNYTIALTAADRVIDRLTMFFHERKDVLNDRDLVSVNDAIDTARFLKILLAENRAILNTPQITDKLGIIYKYSVTEWTNEARSIAVTDVLKVYNAERGLVEAFYETKRGGWSFFR